MNSSYGCENGGHVRHYRTTILVIAGVLAAIFIFYPYQDAHIARTWEMPTSPHASNRRLSTYPVEVQPYKGGVGAWNYPCGSESCGTSVGAKNREDWRQGCESGCRFANVVTEPGSGEACPKHGELLFEMRYTNVPPLSTESYINAECKTPCTICHHDPCEAEVYLGETEGEESHGEYFSCCAMWSGCTAEQEQQLAKLAEPQCKEGPRGREENDGCSNCCEGYVCENNACGENECCVPAPSDPTTIIYIVIAAVLGISGLASVALMNSKPSSKPVAPSSSTSPLSVANVAEQRHMMIFNRIPGDCGCDATVEKPPFDSWFASRGVSEVDFNVMMDAIVEPANAYASHVVGFTLISTVSCGACGWCCMLAEGGAIPGKIQEALNALHAKYPNVKGSMTQSPPGLVFEALGEAPLPQATAVVVDAAVAPVAAVAVGAAMTGADPTEKLRQLKVMLDDGLITQADYEAKKAQILAAM